MVVFEERNTQMNFLKHAKQSVIGADMSPDIFYNLLSKLLVIHYICFQHLLFTTFTRLKIHTSDRRRIYKILWYGLNLTRF